MTIFDLITFSKIVFWTSLFIVFYSYIGYGIVLWILVKLKQAFIKAKPAEQENSYLPTVALVVAAYNEEDFIKEKIENSLGLDYPEELLELVIITDGSSDRTPEITGGYSSVKHLHKPERKGKAAALKRSMEYINASIIVFSDANTRLNKDCIKEIVKHYSDQSVGGVAGEKKIIRQGKESAAAAGEGLYWKYESILKKLDSAFYSTIGAAGELFSVRKDLFEGVPDGTILEDFVLSLKICSKGYILRYEPKAYAEEAPSASIDDEIKRKVRISAGAFQAMVLLKELFNIFKYPILSFQFISHRVLRWTICPIAIVLILLSDLFLVSSEGGVFYKVFLLLQVILCTMAIGGWILAKRAIRVRVLYLPFYFLLMNLSVFLGFRLFILNKQSPLWEKASRQKLPKYH